MKMYNYTKTLNALMNVTEKRKFDEWFSQDDVIPFLQQEIDDDDIIIYASIPHVYIHGVLVHEFKPTTAITSELIEWQSSSPFNSWGYVYSQTDIDIEAPLAGENAKILAEGEQLIFIRKFEGHDPSQNYYELNQKIAHLLELHYVSENMAWCKLDKFGELDEIVKIHQIPLLGKKGTVISFRKSILAEYCGIADRLFLRMFDFTRVNDQEFQGWGRSQPQPFTDDFSIFGRINIEDDNGSYSRGIQLCDVREDKQQILKRYWPSTNDEEKKYVSFIAEDWKNNKVAEISCNPACLASYFEKSDLPFQITPAFFRPEVLAKYKSDTDRYHLDHRDVGCRGVWHLKTFDINEAGQVHTYLHYLGQLPYEEQLHWQQYNEEPKAPISERARKTDIEGSWEEIYDPLMSIKQQLHALAAKQVGWWLLRDEDAPRKVHYPYTSSKDEWAEEFLNLDKLLIEGLEEKWLRNKAIELGADSKKMKSLRALKLVAECLKAHGFDEEKAYLTMTPLHIVHDLRSKLKGHTQGKEAVEIRKKALAEHGSFKAHFEKICGDCDESIKVLSEAFDGMVK